MLPLFGVLCSTIHLVVSNHLAFRRMIHTP